MKPPRRTPPKIREVAARLNKSSGRGRGEERAPPHFARRIARSREQGKLTTARQMPTCGEYTMRAQPRRRAEDIKGQEPVFLRKTFKMICACDADEPDLACWTTKGETFVVKNPDVFSNVVIPRFFKREPLLAVLLFGFAPLLRESLPADDRSSGVLICSLPPSRGHERAAAADVPSYLPANPPAWVWTRELKMHTTHSLLFCWLSLGLRCIGRRRQCHRKCSVCAPQWTRPPVFCPSQKHHVHLQSSHSAASGISTYGTCSEIPAPPTPTTLLTFDDVGLGVLPNAPPTNADKQGKAQA